MKTVCAALNLTTLASVYADVLAEARQAQWSYEELLTRALAVEVAGRQQRAQERRWRAARLPFAARLEAFDFRFQPSVSERIVRELASLSFIQTATNVVFMGPPGVGKTHLACGLASAALDAGHSVQFVTLRELVAQLDAPTARGGMTVVRRYRQPTLLVIDEIGYTRLRPEHAHALFDLVTARYERHPTILTSNLTFAEWGGLLDDDVLATAMLDRLLHHAEVIPINGRSYRMRQRTLGDTTTGA